VAEENNAPRGSGTCSNTAEEGIKTSQLRTLQEKERQNEYNGLILEKPFTTRKQKNRLQRKRFFKTVALGNMKTEKRKVKGPTGTFLSLGDGPAGGG